MLEVRDLTKHYEGAAGAVPVLQGVNLDLEAGDAVSIVGPSGSGKSTLLYILGALERPTSGSVLLDGQDPFLLSGRELAAFRNAVVGFVFQDHHLLQQCTALENVLIPTLVAADGGKDAARGRELLARVGLEERLHHRPAELSGGEKQRVALARALVRNPRLLLCDEPTGNLDEHSASNVASLFFDLHRAGRAILFVVTHNLGLAARFPIRYRLHGRTLVPA